jgi:hypothetical protein
VSKATLADYRELAVALGGEEDNAALKFIDDKIASDPDGPNAIVLADRDQMLMLLATLLDRKP